MLLCHRSEGCEVSKGISDWCWSSLHLCKEEGGRIKGIITTPQSSFHTSLSVDMSAEPVCNTSSSIQFHHHGNEGFSFQHRNLGWHIKSETLVVALWVKALATSPITHVGNRREPTSTCFPLTSVCSLWHKHSPHIHIHIVHAYK